jgi:hypothetical protein
VLPRNDAAKKKPGVVRFEENNLPVVVLGVLCNVIFLQHPLLVSAAGIIAGMWLFFLQKLAVAACRSGVSIFRLWTLFLQLAVPAPLTTVWLFALCPVMAVLLALVTLRESALSSICLHPDGNAAEAWQT